MRLRRVCFRREGDGSPRRPGRAEATKPEKPGRPAGLESGRDFSLHYHPRSFLERVSCYLEEKFLPSLNGATIFSPGIAGFLGVMLGTRSKRKKSRLNWNLKK